MTSRYSARAVLIRPNVTREQAHATEHRAPAYATDPAYAYMGDPAYAYGRGFGYNPNAVGPWQERRLLGSDY